LAGEEEVAGERGCGGAIARITQLVEVANGPGMPFSPADHARSAASYPVIGQHHDEAGAKPPSRFLAARLAAVTRPESRRSSREREQRLEAETVRLQEQLLAAQRQHEREQSRSLSALSTANQLARRRRQRESVDEYVRAYGNAGYGYGGVRFR
jgi:hypothetical protein